VGEAQETYVVGGAQVIDVPGGAQETSEGGAHQIVSSLREALQIHTDAILSERDTDNSPSRSDDVHNANISTIQQDMMNEFTQNRGGSDILTEYGSKYIDINVYIIVIIVG